MRHITNVYQNTLKTYYNIVRTHVERMNNNKDCFTPFLDYCYDIATMEFEDGPEYHAAIEYKSPEANVIIASAERFEEMVQEYLEEDEWNNLLELSYNCKEIK